MSKNSPLIVLAMASAVCVGQAVAFNRDSRGSFGVTVTGPGSVSAQVLLEVSDDPSQGWESDGGCTITVSGTSTATEYLDLIESYRFVRASVLSLSAGSSVNVVFGDQAANGPGIVRSRTKHVNADVDAAGKVTKLSAGVRDVIADLAIGGGIKKSAIMSRHPGGNPIATSAIAAGTTHHYQVELSSDFKFVRIVFRSIETVPITFTSVAVGVNDGTVAYPGISGSWVPVTFGGAAKGTIPARISSTVPSFLASDWIPISSLARSGGGYPLLCVRVYVGGTDGSGAGTGYSYFNYTQNSGMPSPLLWKHGNQAVDGITTPSAYTNTGTSAIDVISGIDWATSKEAATILMVSDSVGGGMGSTVGLTSGAYRAIGRMQGGAFPVVLDASCAMHGQSPETYFAAFQQRIALSKPAIVVYQVGSINTAISSAARANQDMNLAMQVLKICWDLGIVPILKTPYPHFSSTNASNDTYRAAMIVKLLALAANSTPNCPIYVCDVASAVCDPGNTWRYLPSYNFGDNSHMNDAGYDAESVPLEATFRSILGM